MFRAPRRASLFRGIADDEKARADVPVRCRLKAVIDQRE